MRRARRSCGTVAATWLRESCAARVPGATFIFYLLHDAPPVRYRFAGPRGGPRRPVRPASRHPPPAAARLGARPSRSPVGREPARRRAARGRAPAAEGSGFESAARWQASTAPRTARPHAAPLRPTRNTEPIHAAKAQKRERAARRHRRAARTGNVPRPLRQGSKRAGTARGWGGRAVRDSIFKFQSFFIESPDSSRPIAPAGLQKYRRCGFHALLDETGALSRLCIIWHLGSAG